MTPLTACWLLFSLRCRGKVCKPYNSVLGEHFHAHWDVLPLIHNNEDPLIAQIYSSTSSVSVPALNSDAQRQSLIVSCTTNNVKGGSGPGGFRAVVEYKEESWLGKANFRIEGVIHTVPGSGSSPRASKDSSSADADTDSSSSLSEDDDDDVDDADENWEQWTKVKHVPPSHVVAVLEGSWRGEIRWKRVGSGSFTYSGNKSTNTTQHNQHAYTAPSSPNPSHTALPNPSKHPKSNIAESKGDLSLPGTTQDSKDSKGGTKGTMGTGKDKDKAKGEEEWNMLIDLSTLFPVPKQVRPLDRQEKYECRKLWEGVTSRLLKEEFSEATKEKVVIEQRQRDEAGERRRKGEE
ncbi:hypothetical protein D9758_018947 [Tetrapyrgos nigripes]|uniref:Uncharacterized protein n=1 Tax=Tetrapyrgos nigripes TaxID=182062 RepID=A0A8H5EW66_9AGAR|nr:hypothetical protein D9758_018947 [Tetrapyrgos nigripes]